MPESHTFKITIGNDHGAVELKDILVSFLKDKSYDVFDCGVSCGETTDYPDIAAKVAYEIIHKKAARGILLCGSGVGISIAANRFPLIRAALCHDEYTARMSRLHNDANVLIMGGRTTGIETAKGITEVWLNTEFEGGRHKSRIDKLDEIANDAWRIFLSKEHK